MSFHLTVVVVVLLLLLIIIIIVVVEVVVVVDFDVFFDFYSFPVLFVESPWFRNTEG